MDQKLLRELQLAELSIFREFAAICEAHGLQYFLDGGTLLGAVRHKGFIPWDDDLDVAMPRKDYERFCQIAPDALPEGLFFQSYHSDPHYPNPFAKIRREGTTFGEKIYEGCKMRGGVFIDVFPYDVFPEKRSQQLRQGLSVEWYKHLLLCKDRVRPWRGMTGKRRLVKMIEYLPFFPLSGLFSHEWLARRYDRALTRYEGTETGRIKEPDLRFGKVVVPSECMREFVDLDFEDMKAKCPANYDALLKGLYGDYMQLPPENQRGDWHHVTEIRL